MSENPYDPPKSPEGAQHPRRTTSGSIVACVVLLLLSIPASIIAFLGVCFVAASATDAIGIGKDYDPLIAGLWIGAISGVVVFGFMIWAAVRALWRK